MRLMFHLMMLLMACFISNIVAGMMNLVTLFKESDACGKFGLIGKKLYKSGFVKLREASIKNRIAPKKLSNMLKASLSCYFDIRMLNKVTVYWGAPIHVLEKHFKKFKIKGIVALTFGYNIFFKDHETNNPDPTTLALIRHEIVHCEQYRRANEDFNKFGYLYFKEICKAGFSYEECKYEKEAYGTLNYATCNHNKQ